MKILVIGSINYDFVTTTNLFPKSGETQSGVSFKNFHGGKGANQAVAAARFNDNVSMLGCVGNDKIGEELLQNLKKEKINTSLVSKVDSSSGIANIIVEKGDNRIITIAGANSFVNEKLLTKYFKEINQFDFILLQNEVDETTLKYITDIKSDQFKIIYNPAPYQPISQSILDKIDFLTPNEIEYESLVNSDLIINEKKMIITCGAKGVIFDGHLYEAPKVNVVDTTGAGDTFNGVFVAMLADGQPPNIAIKTAVQAASISVTKHGAQSGMPKLGDL